MRVCLGSNHRIILSQSMDVCVALSNPVLRYCRMFKLVHCPRTTGRARMDKNVHEKRLQRLSRMRDQNYAQYSNHYKFITQTNWHTYTRTYITNLSTSTLAHTHAHSHHIRAACATASPFIHSFTTNDAIKCVQVNANIGALIAACPGARSASGRLVTRVWNAEAQVNQH